MSRFEPEKRDWVSVTEKLPETYTPVLVFVDGDFRIAELAVDDDGSSYWSADKFYHPVADGEVTHWSPLVGPNGEVP